MNENLREWLGLKPHYLWAYAGAVLLAAGCLADSLWPIVLFFIGATLLLVLFNYRTRLYLRRAKGLPRSTRLATRFAAWLWTATHFALIAAKCFLLSRGVSVMEWIVKAFDSG